MTTDVVSFLKKLCEQIRKRFLLSEDCVLAKLSLLGPSGIGNPSTERKEKPSIVSLALHFPNLAKEEDLDQLEGGDHSDFARDSVSHLYGLEPPAFWSRLRKLSDGN